MKTPVFILAGLFWRLICVERFLRLALQPGHQDLLADLDGLVWVIFFE
jgi:hypothetical protein